jgi:hypothetical protein
MEDIVSKVNMQVIETGKLFVLYKANLQQEGECDNDNKFFLQSAHC